MADAAFALILIPGLMCDEALWRHQRTALERAGASVSVADHGYADSIEAMAQAILATYPGPLAVAGHSMGGRVALEIARLAGKRLRGLALLDTGYRPMAVGAAGRQELRGRLQLLELALREGIATMAANWLKGMLPTARLSDALLTGKIVQMFARHGVAHFAAQLHALIHRPDASAQLSRLRCPTLLMCGQQDAWASPAQHQEMADQIGNCTLAHVAECGHMAPMERPQAVSAALCDWYTSLA